MDTKTLLFLIIDIAIFILLIIIKTVFYFRIKRRKTLARWFYFNRYSIVNSSSEISKGLKKSQNILSIILFVFTIFSVVFITMLFKFHS